MTISDILPLCCTSQCVEICDSDGYIYSGTVGTLFLDGWDDWEVCELFACVEGTLFIALSCPFSNAELWNKHTFGTYGRLNK
jgi:hypothetical protein